MKTDYFQLWFLYKSDYKIEHIFLFFKQMKVSRITLWIGDCHFYTEGYLKLRLQLLQVKTLTHYFAYFDQSGEMENKILKSSFFPKTNLPYVSNKILPKLQCSFIGFEIPTWKSSKWTKKIEIYLCVFLTKPVNLQGRSESKLSGSQALL